MDYFNESEEEMKNAMMHQLSENEDPQIIPHEDLYGGEIHFDPENKNEEEKIDLQLNSKQQMEIEPLDQIPDRINPLLDEINENRKPHTIPVSKVYYERCNRTPIMEEGYERLPHMKITVMKSNADAFNNCTEYIVTEKGVIKSEKNTKNEDVMIGRQQATADEIRPNDIILPSTDRAISRIHCKIIYKNGFYTKKKRSIPDNLLTFLSIQDPKFGAYSPAYQLPLYLYRLIFQFLKPEKKFYIVDIGSVFGTYIRIKHSRPNVIEKGQVYLIGADSLFFITNVAPAITEKFLIKEGDNEEFYKFLVMEHKTGTVIHGLDVMEQANFDHYKNKMNEENGVNETQRDGKMITRPYLILEFQGNSNITANTKHMFVGDASSESDKEFKVGRAQDCSILINHNTISRRQCRIKYQAKYDRWTLNDGDTSKESANGTWISLTDYRMKKARDESDPKEIEHESEIKISDSILKIEIKNNEPAKLD